MLENRVKELRTETGIEGREIWPKKMNVSQQTNQPYRKWGKNVLPSDIIDSFESKIFSCVNGLHIKAIGRENDTGISFGNGTDVIKTL